MNDKVIFVDIARRVATRVGFTFTKQMNIDISQQLETLKINI